MEQPTTAAAPQSTSAFAVMACGLWLCAAGAPIAALYLFANPAVSAVLSALEVDLPIVSKVCLDLGAMLRTTAGIAGAIGVILLSLAPFVIGRPGRRAAKRYVAMAVLALLATAIVWFVAKMPIDMLQEKLAGYDLEHIR